MPENETPTNPGHPTSPANPKTPTSEDAELKAINVIVASLNPLKEEQRLRALDYVLRRFKVTALQEAPATATPPAFQSSSATSTTGLTPSAPARATDIRTLKETKQPKSANEMAALVAFYLSEIASPEEQKQEISKADIEHYFKLANFRLTAKAGQTLVNAKSSGYLDAGSGTGQYKLNPVGYNLVVHRMGSGTAVPRRRQRTAHRKNGKKPARGKK